MGSILDSIGIRSIFGGDIGGTGNYMTHDWIKGIHSGDGGSGGTCCIPDSINSVRNDGDDIIYTWDHFLEREVEP